MKLSQRIPLIVLVNLLPLISLIYGSYQAWRQITGFSHYTTTEGEVVRSKVIRYSNYERAKKGFTTDAFIPVVHYRYMVDGSGYTNEEVYPITRTGTQKWAQTVVQDYPAGRKVMVHYNPQSPDESYLVQYESSLPYIYMAFGFVLLVFLNLLCPPIRKALYRKDDQIVEMS